MSRSYKKFPCVKDSGNSKKFAKRSANKRVRQTNEIQSGKQYKKVYCSWNICDWKQVETLREYLKFADYMDVLYPKQSKTRSELINEWKKWFRRK